MNDKPDLLNIIEAAMNTCHAEGDYDPENDYIKDPLCRRVYHALGQSAAEITRLREAVRVLAHDKVNGVPDMIGADVVSNRIAYDAVNKALSNPIAAAVRGEVKHGN